MDDNTEKRTQGKGEREREKRRVFLTFKLSFLVVVVKIGTSFVVLSLFLLS